MTRWRKDELEAALNSKGWVLDSRDIEHAVEFELIKGVKVNLYNTGKFTFGGPKSDFKSAVEEFVKAGPDAADAGDKSMVLKREPPKLLVNLNVGCSSCTVTTRMLEMIWS